MEAFAKLYEEKCVEHGVKANDFFLKQLKESGDRKGLRSLYLSGHLKETFDHRVTSKDLQPIAEALIAISAPEAGESASIRLEELDLQNNNIGAETEEAETIFTATWETFLTRGLPSLRFLHTVNLRANNISSNLCEILCRYLSDNSSIENLCLSSNPLGEKGGQALAELLAVNRTLTALDIGNCGINLKALISLTQSVAGSTTLKSLTLDALDTRSATTETASHIGRMIQRNKSLRSLSLAKLSLGDGEAKILAEFLVENRSLTSLSLSSNQIAGQGAKALMTCVFQHLPPLSSLDLSNNRIMDEGALAVGKALAVNGSLKTVNLRNNRIFDSGLVAIANGLKENASLTRVLVWDNNFDKESMEAFDELYNGRWKSLGVQSDIRPYQVDGQVFLAREDC